MWKHSSFITKIHDFFILAKSLEKAFLQNIAKRNSVVLIITAVITIIIESGLLARLFYVQPRLATTSSKVYFCLYISLMFIAILSLALQAPFKTNPKKLYWFHISCTALYLLWNVILNSYELSRNNTTSALTFVSSIIFVATLMQFRPKHMMFLQIFTYALFSWINYERIIDKINPTIVVSVAIVINLFFYYYEIQSVYTQIQVEKMSTRLENDRILESKRYLKRLKDAQIQTAIYHHDLRHSLKLMEQMALQGDVKKLQSFVSSSHSNLEKPTFYCDNETVNLILGSFSQRAEEQDTDFQTDILLPEELSIEDTELCSLLSNILENAIHGAEKQENKELRKVFVKAVFNDNKLVILVENNFFGEVIIQNGIPITSKQQEYHGYGVQSIIKIAERYHGIYTFETEGTTFSAKVLLHI